MNTVFTSAVNVLGYDVAPLAPTGAVHQTTDGLGDDIVVSLNDSLLSDSSLRKYHTAAGAIAMAKIATDMILLGREGKTWTLLMDAATMCAGNQYQAILASFPDRSALLAADGSTLHSGCRAAQQSGGEGGGRSGSGEGEGATADIAAGAEALEETARIRCCEKEVTVNNLITRPGP